MKILLVTSASVPESFKRLVATLRSVIGTCEHLRLDQNMNLSAQKKLLEIHRKTMSFDRHVLCYDHAQNLPSRLNLFVHFNELTLLSLQLETSAHRRIIRNFAHDAPWMRWAGSDRRSLNIYQREGIDAHLLPPLVVTPTWQLHKSALRPPRCHVLGTDNGKYALILPKIPGFYLTPSDDDIIAYLSREMTYGDVLFVQESKFLERHILSTAMALGAVVVVPSAMMDGEHSRSLLRGACVRVDSTAELAALFAQMQGPTFEQLIERSLNQAHMFSAESVARVLGRLLIQPGRNCNAYRSRSNWL